MTSGLDKVRQVSARAQAALAEGRVDDAIEDYRQAIRLAEEHGATGPALTDAHRGHAVALMSRSDWLEAEDAFREALEKAQEIEDELRIGRALNGLAAVAFERGDWRSSEACYDSARHHAAMAEDLRLLGQIEQNLGALYSARGEYVRAEECFRDAIKRFDAIGGDFCAARTLNNLGLCLMKQERHEEAVPEFEMALETCRRHGDTALMIKVLINKGRLSLRRNRPTEAQSCAFRAWEMVEDQAPGPVSAGALCLMGEIARETGDWVNATHNLRRALEHSDNRKAPLIEAETWVQIGYLNRDRGNLSRALNSWRFARHLYRLLGAELEVDALLDVIDRHEEAWHENEQMVRVAVGAA
ncbi:MAG TPA: tetratricopeptide repeat protein [Gemmatimonadota bacterium]|nr:tetratricopeptide repeat protein [Gemmatimonadota bacterium]